MNEIRHIVFDIGKVLIHYDPEIPFLRLIPDDTKRRWFFDNVCTAQWNLEQDRGRGWDEAELISRYPELEDNVRAFRRRWPEILFISFTIRGSLIRVISARDMSRAERRSYAKAKEA